MQAPLLSAAHGVGVSQSCFATRAPRERWRRRNVTGRGPGLSAEHNGAPPSTSLAFRLAGRDWPGGDEFASYDHMCIYSEVGLWGSFLHQPALGRLPYFRLYELSCQGKQTHVMEGKATVGRGLSPVHTALARPRSERRDPAGGRKWQRQRLSTQQWPWGVVLRAPGWV